MENKKLGFWFNIIGLVLAIISVFLMFLPAMRVAITSTNVEKGLYNAFQTMFGYNESNRGVSVNIIGFSFMNCLGGILILLGIVIMVINVAKPNWGGKVGAIIRKAVAGALLVIGGIFAFLTVQFVVTTNGADWDLFTKSLSEWSILRGIVTILSGFSAIASIVVDKLKSSTK